MSYHPTRRYRRPAPRPALSGFMDSLIDFVTPGGSGIINAAADRATAACVSAANAHTANLDKQIATIAAGWHPSGYYRPDQLRAVVEQVVILLNYAVDQVERAPDSTSDATFTKNQALDDIARKMNDAVAYNGKADEAAAAGATVDMPGLKQWVLNAMNAASSALVSAYTLNCEVDMFSRAVNGFLAVLAGVWAALEAIVGVVYDGTKKLLKVAGGALDAAAMLTTILPWIAGGALAFYLYKRIKETT
jgi:hypothetical protein